MIRRTMLLVLCVLAFLAGPALAKRRGPMIATHTLIGACTGTLVGASAGMLTYGVNKNTGGEMILADAMFGFAGGAAAGAGLGVVFYDDDVPGNGYPLWGYIAAGTGLGAVIGTFFAMFPWALSTPDNKDPMNFSQGSLGLGVGGLIGASLGLTAGIVDFSLRSGRHGGVTVGLQPEMHPLIHEPEKKTSVVMACKLAEVEF